MPTDKDHIEPAPGTAEHNARCRLKRMPTPKSTTQLRLPHFPRHDVWPFPNLKASHADSLNTQR